MYKQIIAQQRHGNKKRLPCCSMYAKHVMSAAAEKTEPTRNGAGHGALRP